LLPSGVEQRHRRVVTETKRGPDKERFDARAKLGYFGREVIERRPRGQLSQKRLNRCARGLIGKPNARQHPQRDHR
jgi:hypothetical protein